MQSLTQSSAASTLVTRVLLVLAEVRTPWIVVANYSLAHRLLRRPPEAIQRLLARPILVMPDAPGSADWKALLRAYDVVLADACTFPFPDRERELWNFTAGLKRLLRELTVLAYRLSRMRGEAKMARSDLSAAYLSREYSTARQEVEAMIACASQGTQLPVDSRCPFQGADVDSSQQSYADSLRAVRAGQVATAVLNASLNAKERTLLTSITQEGAAPPKTAANVVKLPRRKLTPADLQAAGRLHIESLAAPKKESEE